MASSAEAGSSSEPATSKQPHLAKQDLEKLNPAELHPLSPEVISRQATINIGAPDDTTLRSAPCAPWRLPSADLRRRRLHALTAVFTAQARSGTSRTASRPS